MLGNLELRSLLDTIVSDENSENWWLPGLFEKNTRDRLPENLAIVQSPPQEDRNYNCFNFAFDLQNHTPLLGMDGWEYSRKLDTVVDRLIDNKILLASDVPIPEALVIYRSDDGHISHAGRMTPEGKVISKWSWGPLLDHGVYDVPTSYGDTVEYYTGVKSGKEAILKDFLRHSEK